MRGSFALLLLLWVAVLNGQTLNPQKLAPASIAAKDSVITPTKALDSLINDSTLQNRPPIGDIETTINYHAEDSLFFDIQSRELELYGETHIDYGEITLEAERTNVNWNTRAIKAEYLVDSTGKKVGKPVFSEGDDVYVTEDILYNFKTRRALIKGVITEQDGGFMHGDDVKKNADNELFIRGARYTTCNLEHPHFFIETTKLKVIPKNKVVAGPFIMKFRDLPTILGFPFGMFPQPKKRASGIVVPTYGEEERRGFFLRDGGYYLALNDYVDLRLTGDIYSKGGNALNFNSNYRKRYAYNGTFNFSYNKNVTNNVESVTETNDYWVRWNHSPQSRGNSSISASVSAGSSTYNDNNNLVAQDFNRSINSQFASNVSYRTRFRGTPFSFSSNLRHSQNVQTGIVNLTLPDLTLSMSRIYPFKGAVKSSKSPLSKLSFSHNMVSKNDLTNSPRGSFGNFDVINENNDSEDTLAFNLNNLDKILERSDFGVKHAVPISTSLSLLKYFTVNPSFNYTELWYMRELDYTFVEEENGVRVDTLSGFSRAGYWNSSASLNTRVYGTMFFKKGKIQAIRHVMTPSLSFSYRPDFSDPKYGVYRTIQTDTSGTERVVNKYQSFAYGTTPTGESQTIGFSLTNNIEMKVASKKDTITGFKKVKLLDNIGISTGYNLAADSFKLSNISLNTRTSILNNRVSINFSGTLEPYEYLLLSESIADDGTRTVRQRRLDRYSWNNGNGLGNLSNMNIAVSLDLSPKKGKKNGGGNNNGSLNQGFDPPGGPPTEDQGVDGLTEIEREEMQFIQDNPELYVDFDMPWTLRANYSINRRRQGFQDPTITQSLSFNGTLALTKNTQITFNSGYDLENKEFTTTRVSVARDLHCWSMSFNWVPFGRYQSYFVSIRAKSSLLQDLKVEKRRSFVDFFN